MEIYYIKLFIIAIVSTWWIFKKVLRIALLKNIVDNPDARKLQKTPVPVLGGIAVFFGMVVALTITRLTFDTRTLFAIMGAMSIMLYTGTIDDVLSLTPRTRFLIQIAIVLTLIYANNYSLNDFHGLWGIYNVSPWIAVPLTVFACVGIINAINMIDGVNGLCSGFCIVACSTFSIAFIKGNDIEAASLSILSIGSLLPFFCHNVFGKKSKMYIGDGGTLLMGTIMSSFVIGALNVNSPLAEKVDPNFGLIPFVLAVLSIPVFDCLRVMFGRILRRTSPFYPDRTHLHHMFFDMGFSHIGITAIELLANIFVIVSWYISYRLGASISMQFYIVIALATLVTFGFYTWARRQERKDTRIYNIMRRIGQKTHVSHSQWFESFRNFLDRGC